MKFSFAKVILEILAVILLLAIVLTGALIWRLSEGPLDLDFLKEQIENAISDARGGRDVDIDGVALAWSEDRRRIEARLTGVIAYDADREVQATAQSGAVTFDTVELFKGDIRINAIRLENGHTGVFRNEAGEWSFGVPKPVSEQAAASAELEIGDWRAFLPALRGAISVNSFEKVEFTDFEIDLYDDVAGLKWTARDAFGEWTADGEGVKLTLSADVEGDAAPDTLQVTFYSDPGVQEFLFEIGATNVDPQRMASLIAAREPPFEYKGRADIVFGGEASEIDGVHRLQLSAASEGGEVFLGDQRHPIDAIGFELIYDVADTSILLTGLHLETERLSGDFTGEFNVAALLEAEAASQSIPLLLTANDLELDFTPVFERGWTIETVDVSAVLHPEEKALDIERLILANSALDGTANGRMWLEERPIPDDELAQLRAEAGEFEEVAETRLKFAATLSAQAEGQAKKRDILDFWPVNLGAMSRSWVEDHIEAGTATELDFRMDLRPDTYERGYLSPESLNLRFRVEGAQVSFLDDVPPVSNAKGVGVLTGNGLRIEMESGELGGWRLDEGVIDLPQFFPQGETAVITTTGRGDIKSLMWILENSSLKTASEAGLVIDTMSGFGGLEAKISWPMVAEILEEDIKFDVSGGFLDSSIPNLAGGFGLINSDVDVALDNQTLILRGQGAFGPAPVEFNWIETFPEPGEQYGHSRLEATAVVTPDFLNAFNIAARNVLAGEIEVQLSADGQGRDFEAIDARLDLTHAAIDLSEIGWIKRVNEPASGVVRYARNVDGLTLTSGDIEAEDLALSGEVYFHQQSGLQRAAIDRIYAKDRMDLRGAILRGPDGRFTVDVSGPLLNATDWIDGLMSMSASSSGVQPPEDGPDASVTIAVDQLILREDAVLTNSQLVVEADQGIVTKGLVAGTIGDNLGLEATLEVDDDQRIVNLRSDDAGWVIRVLTKLEYFKSGRLNLVGRFGEDVGAAELKLNDVRLKNAPVFAQIFSLASLQGLSDVLSGDGLLFTNIDAPLRFRDGRVDFLGARASGPAMGLTLRGWLAPGTGDLNLDGVVVPSFGVNSALGGIPIIGDLFVSRRGEGVFAIVYSVRGNLERARVAINPLSAVTPGFLRRIMENPSEPPPSFDDAPQEKAEENNVAP